MGNREIQFSIIIPVYQAKDTLRRCVSSCLEQRDVADGELEVILVDDGSTDGSSDICDKIALEDADRRAAAADCEDADRPTAATGCKDADRLIAAAGCKDADRLIAAAGNEDADRHTAVAGNEDSDRRTAATGCEDADKLTAVAGSEDADSFARARAVVGGGYRKLGRVKVIHTENFGVSHARNTGIDAAKGRFLFFVDSDDEVSPGFIDGLFKYADDMTVLVDGSGKYTSPQKISGFQYIENSVLNENTHVWGKMFDRKTITEENIRFDESLTIGEDLIFLIDVSLSQGRQHTIRCCSESGYIYSDNAQGAMKSSFKENYLDELACWKMAEERLLPCMREISAYAFVNVAASQIKTALLVLGKIALLDDDSADEALVSRAVSKCKGQIDHALKVKGCFAGLSFGYQIKVILFKINPVLYLKMYRRHKGRGTVTG